jgi:DNA-directed RNA polymerase subunit N (RpoN/RPB10)
MIIPVRCFACGKVLADKWQSYERQCREADEKKLATVGEQPTEVGQKTARGLILDELGIKRLCCRTVMLAHVDISLVI